MYYMKRKFEEIRRKILYYLEKRTMTKMELSKTINADYRTIERHLIWLLGNEKIKKIEKNKKVYYKVI